MAAAWVLIGLFAAWLPGAAASAAELVANAQDRRFLLTPQELYLNKDDFVILDARNPASSPAPAEVIAGSQFAPWQWTAIGGSDNLRASLLKDPRVVKAQLAALGVNGSRPVAVYGSWEQSSGPEGRLFWTLDLLGFVPGVLVLDGGIEAWKRAGLPVVATPANSSQRLSDLAAAAAANPAVSAAIEGRRFTSTDFALSIVNRAVANASLIDVRSQEEYEGLSTKDGAPRSGHIPGASLWTWSVQSFGNSVNGSLKPCDQIRRSLPAGASKAQEVVLYCGRGVRAGFAYLVLRGCGVGSDLEAQRLRNYDGSWLHWSANFSLPCNAAQRGVGCTPLAAASSGAKLSGLLDLDVANATGFPANEKSAAAVGAGLLSFLGLATPATAEVSLQPIGAASVRAAYNITIPANFQGPKVADVLSSLLQVSASPTNLGSSISSAVARLTASSATIAVTALPPPTATALVPPSSSGSDGAQTSSTLGTSSIWAVLLAVPLASLQAIL